jgi:targeting protein for Xklp2
LWFLNLDFDVLMALAADGGSASTPKMQRPPPPPTINVAPAISTCARSTLKTEAHTPAIEVAPAISTCVRSTLKTEARTPKTQQLCKAGPAAGSISIKRSVVK